MKFKIQSAESVSNQQQNFIFEVHLIYINIKEYTFEEITINPYKVDISPTKICNFHKFFI